jgi:hypothetical protein
MAELGEDGVFFGKEDEELVATNYALPVALNFGPDLSQESFG